MFDRGEEILKMKKIIVFLFVLVLIVVLLVPLIGAAKVTQTFTGGTDGLEIRVPQAEFIEQNIVAQLNLHVFNKSDGLLVDNTTTECTLHLFNKTGNHIITDNLGFDDDSSDFFININADNFSQLGLHSFIVQCNTSRFGGFVSGSVIVTTSGEEEITTDTTAVMIAIVLFGLLFIILGSVMLLRRER